VAESAMHGYVNKMPLRWMAEQTFGRGFFDRKKMGFAMPISSWLASDEFYPVVRESLIHDDSPLLNYFRREPIEQLLLEHKARQNKGLQLWSLLFLSKWLKRLSP
jgi:asparagine synthase (glutamine-hydrolysing)